MSNILYKNLNTPYWMGEDYFEDMSCFSIHRTKAGDIISINEMEDDHLRNTIALYIKMLRESKKLIEQESTSKFKAAVESRSIEAAQDKALRYAKNFPVMISRYLYEALIRNLDIRELIEDLQFTLGRKERLTPINAMLSYSEEEELDEEDDE